MPLPVLSLARTVVERSLESSAIDIDAYAAAVIKYAESPQEVTRRAEVQLRIDIYRDAWLSALQTVLSASLKPAVYDVVKVFGDLSRNPAKRIWRELAVLYTAPARRWTDKTDDGEKYQKIQKQARYTPFATFWPDVEELLQVCNDVLIWPEVVTLDDGAKLPVNRYAAGNSWTIVWSTQVPGMMECVCELRDIEDPNGKSDRVYHIWTDQWYAAFRKNEKGDLERNDIVQEAGPRNPYRRLPHWLIRRRSWQDLDLDVTSGNDLVRGTLSGGVAQQFYRYHQKMSGFKQVAVTGSDIETSGPQQLLDPGAVLRMVGQDMSLQIIDWQLDLSSAQHVMDIDELRLAAANGINPERFKRTANYQTTFGAAMSERPVEHLRSRMVPVLGLAEEQYYVSCCHVWDCHGLDDVPDPDADFRVEHVPLHAPEDPEKQLETDAKELALLLVDHIGLLKRRHPELSDDQAKEELRRIAGNIEEVQKLKVQHNIPSDPTTESRSAEANGRLGPLVRDAGKPPGPRPGQPPAEGE